MQLKLRQILFCQRKAFFFNFWTTLVFSGISIAKPKARLHRLHKRGGVVAVHSLSPSDVGLSRIQRRQHRVAYEWEFDRQRHGIF